MSSIGADLIGALRAQGFAERHCSRIAGIIAAERDPAEALQRLRDAVVQVNDVPVKARYQTPTEKCAAMLESCAFSLERIADRLTGTMRVHFD